MKQWQYKLGLFALFPFLAAMADPSLVVVTGANGFIGRNVVEHMLQQGYRVRALVRNQSAAELPSHPNLEIIEGDLSKPEAIQRAMSEAAYVVNAAGFVSDWGPRDQFYEANVTGVRNLLAATEQMPGIKRLVHLSTIDVLGLKPNATLNDESPPRPSGHPYPDSKLEGEKLVREYQRRHGRAVILRPTWVFGPGDKKFLPELLASLQKKEFVYFGGPHKKVNMVYVGNLVGAIEKAMVEQNAEGKTYIVSDQPVEWKDLVEKVTTEFKLNNKISNVPMFVAQGLATGMELIHRIKAKDGRPTLTRWVVNALGSNQTVETKIQKELNLERRYTLPESFEKTFQSMHGPKPRRQK